MMEKQESMQNGPNPWNEVFKKEGRVFGGPQSDMPGIVKLLKERNAQNVLDLGCGTGRHTIFLAQNGFNVYGLDSSPEGIKTTRQWLSEEGLQAVLHLGNMTEVLPYGDAFFDGLICIRVMHHADSATVRKIAQEITRVVKHGGLLFVAVANSRGMAKTWQEVEPGSWMPMDGLEKGLIHHFFTPPELKEVFSAFDITGIHLDEMQCYCLTGYKK
jgi:2-polyprenyl-3-methyl-5-hydroxy-6-metoxy-1,4-benzoquinol methylase